MRAVVKLCLLEGDVVSPSLASDVAQGCFTATGCTFVVCAAQSVIKGGVKSRNVRVCNSDAADIDGAAKRVSGQQYVFTPRLDALIRTILALELT